MIVTDIKRKTNEATGCRLEKKNFFWVEIFWRMVGAGPLLAPTTMDTTGPCSNTRGRSGNRKKRTMEASEDLSFCSQEKKIVEACGQSFFFFFH